MLWSVAYTQGFGTNEMESGFSMPLLQRKVVSCIFALKALQVFSYEKYILEVGSMYEHN